MVSGTNHEPVRSTIRPRYAGSSAVITPTRRGKCSRTTAGRSTLLDEMPTPRRTVPPNSPASPPYDRQTMPAAMAAQPMASARLLPKRSEILSMKMAEAP